MAGCSCQARAAHAGKRPLFGPAANSTICEPIRSIESEAKVRGLLRGSSAHPQSEGRALRNREWLLFFFDVCVCATRSQGKWKRISDHGGGGGHDEGSPLIQKIPRQLLSSYTTEAQLNSHLRGLCSLDILKQYRGTVLFSIFLIIWSTLGFLAALQRGKQAQQLRARLSGCVGCRKKRRMSCWLRLCYGKSKCLGSKQCVSMRNCLRKQQQD